MKSREAFDTARFLGPLHIHTITVGGILPTRRGCQMMNRSRTDRFIWPWANEPVVKSPFALAKGTTRIPRHEHDRDKQNRAFLSFDSESSLTSACHLYFQLAQPTECTGGCDSAGSALPRPFRLTFLDPFLTGDSPRTCSNVWSRTATQHWTSITTATRSGDGGGDMYTFSQDILRVPTRWAVLLLSSRHPPPGQLQPSS